MVQRMTSDDRGELLKELAEADRLTFTDKPMPIRVTRKATT